MQLKKQNNLCYFFKDEPLKTACYDDIKAICHNNKTDITGYASTKKIVFKKNAHSLQTIKTPSTEVKKGKRIVEVVHNNAKNITFNNDGNFCAYTTNFNSKIIILKKNK